MGPKRFAFAQDTVMTQQQPQPEYLKICYKQYVGALVRPSISWVLFGEYNGTASHSVEGLLAP